MLVAILIESVLLDVSSVLDVAAYPLSIISLLRFIPSGRSLETVSKSTNDTLST